MINRIDKSNEFLTKMFSGLIKKKEEVCISKYLCLFIYLFAVIIIVCNEFARNFLWFCRSIDRLGRSIGRLFSCCFFGVLLDRLRSRVCYEIECCFYYCCFRFLIEVIYKSVYVSISWNGEVLWCSGMRELYFHFTICCCVYVKTVDLIHNALRRTRYISPYHIY